MSERKGRQLLVLDVGKLKEDVERCAKESGQLPSQWARAALRAAVEAAGVSPEPAAVPTPRRRLDGPTVRFDMRLLVSEHQTLVELASRENLSMAEYIARLLTSPTNTVVGPKSLEALAQSNYQLTKLAGNFNQLVRHLHTKPGQLTTADHKLIRDTVEAAQAHIKQASRFIAAYSATRRTGNGGWRKSEASKPSPASPTQE